MNFSQAASTYTYRFYKNPALPYSLWKHFPQQARRFESQSTELNGIYHLFPSNIGFWFGLTAAFFTEPNNSTLESMAYPIEPNVGSLANGLTAIAAKFPQLRNHPIVDMAA